jgi:hypothetical protein
MQALREGKRCVTAYWLNDVVMKQQVLPPWQALHFPTPFRYVQMCLLCVRIRELTQACVNVMMIIL